MEKEKKAVEWYDNEVNQLVSMLITNQLSISRYNNLKQKVLNQAKQMEKEQIKQDVYNVYKLILSNPIEKSGKTPTELFEIYYESKYGKYE